ncbi:MAG TPA: hypothetical protein VNU66_11020 [Mycobacteriales bacterium]|nr:hypothetical protein [Mycobacteriales bacterium]
MTRSKTLPGVLCFEGEWTDDLRNNQSVLPTLEHLKRLEQLDYIHRDVATREELSYYAGRFARRARREYASFRTVYLPMHGAPGALFVSGTTSLSLSDLAEDLGSTCEGRAVYFGACSALRAPAQVRNFLARTSATLVCGYTKDVDWLESSAIDLLLLPALSRQAKRNGAEAYMNSNALAAFTKKLGLTFRYA